MKKERVFTFDLVRAICPLIVLLYHFTELSIYLELPYILPCQSKVGYAPTLFFMVSGGALYLSYQEKLDLIPYLKKRWLGIFPLFYVIWLGSFILLSFLNERLLLHPWYTFPLTLIGFDGYLSNYFDTWYLVGEWFLGGLIACYLLFPLFRRISKWKNAWVLLCLATVIEVILAHQEVITNQNMLTVFVSFCTGMAVTAARNFCKEKWCVCVPLAVLAFAVSVILPADMVTTVFQAQIRAAATFVILFPFQDTLAKCKPLYSITKSLAHISYPYYLIQHIIVQIVVFMIPSLTGNGVDLLLLVLAATYIGAYCITFAQDYIMKNLLKPKSS